MVRFVQNEQGAGGEVAQPVLQPDGVRRIAQQRVRDDEAAVRGPRIDAVASFDPLLAHVLAVVDHERQAEPFLELLAPLRHDRWRCGDDDAVHALPHHELAKDESRFDRLAQAHVVGDEEIDAR